MTWTPIDEQRLSTLIADAVSAMGPIERSLWSLLRLPPAKWRLSPWGDEGGGFWVVGVIGERVVWFNDIEWGFNVSRYDDRGEIAEYWCNQGELQHTIYHLVRHLEGEKSPGKRGPPEPLEANP